MVHSAVVPNKHTYVAVMRYRERERERDRERQRERERERERDVCLEVILGPVDIYE